jgi:Ni/Fe-hydrogenase 1 B-type cytochrome subunit
MNHSVGATVTPAASDELIRTFVWEWPVRLAHWLVVFSLIVLVFTGIYIGRPFLVSPGPSQERFVMGTVKVVHFYAAIVFTLSVLARILWMFLGNQYANWKEFLPVPRPRRRGLVPMLKFYLFLRPDPPLFIGHNPLAGATYSLVFLVYLMMSATGFALYSVYAPLGSHMLVFRDLLPLFGGAQGARWIHHIGMWLLLGFAVHHVYSAVMMAMIERKGTLESIFSGYKFFTRADLGEERGAPARGDDVAR